MSNGNQKKAKEKQEKLLLDKETLEGITDMSDAVDKLPDTDKNINNTEKLLPLKSNIEPEKQLKAISYVQTVIMDVLAKLKKKYPNINLAEIRPESLERIVAVHPVSLNLTERVAIKDFVRVIREKGPTSEYFTKSWGDVVSQADEASKGWTKKLENMWKRDKVATIALFAAGTAGIYLGYKLITKIWNWGKKKAKGEKAEKKEKEGTPAWAKKILIPIGIMIAGGIIGKEKLKELLGMMGLDELKELLKKGKALPAEAGKILNEEAERRGITVDAAKKKAGEAGEKARDLMRRPETISEKEALNHANLFIVTWGLIKLYTIDPDITETFRNKIADAFSVLNDKTVGEINKAYTEHKHKGSIPLKELGIAEAGIDEKALFYAAGIIVKTKSQYKKLAEKDADNLKLNEFLSHLAKDPAIRIGTDVQNSVVDAIGKLKITSVGVGEIDKLMEENHIEKLIENEQEGYFKSLAKKFGIETELNEDDKKALWRVLASLYLRTNLNADKNVVKGRIGQMTSSEKVIEAGVKFVENIQNQSNPLILKIVEKYDIKRPGNPEYDQILKQNFIYDKLTIKDAFQMMLLAEGMDLDKPSTGGALDQAKDLAVMMLILKILKRNGDQASYSKYLGNIINAPADLKINVNLKAFQPYLKSLGAYAVKSAKRQAASASDVLGAMRDKYTIEQLEKMDWIEFAWESGKQGVGGAWEIPKELWFTLAKNFGDVMDEKTDGTSIMKMVLVMGGTLFYSQHGDKNLGLVYLAGKYYFIKPLGIGIETMEALVKKGPFSGVPFKTYIMGAAPFIVIGGAVGGVTAINKGVIKTGLGILRGSARGVLAPVSMPVAGGRFVRGGYRYGKIAWNRLKFGKGNIASLKQTADLFMEYDKKTPSSHKGALRERLATLHKNPWNQIKMFLYGDLYERARFRWAGHFTSAYNMFFNFNPNNLDTDSRGLSIKAKGHISDKILDSAKRMKSVIAKIKETIPDMEKISKDELVKRLEKLAEPNTYENKEPLIGDNELKGLKRRIEKNFEKFKKALKAEIKILETAGAPAAAVTEALGQGKYRYMGEEFTFTDEQIKNEAAKFNGDTEKAAKSLCEQQWNEPRQISETKGKRTYRYRGGEFTLSEAEYSGKSVEQIKQACEAKFAEAVSITEIRTNAKGLKEYKIRNKWVELIEDPKTIGEAKTRCIEELKKSGKPFDVKIIEQSKLLRFWPVLQKTAGAGIAALIIYHLETAQDKRIAVAETTLGLGAFMTGVKTTELTFGRFFKHPVAKGIVDFMGGIAATFGLQGTINEIIEKHWPKGAGIQQISLEGAALIEKIGTRSITKISAKSLEKGLLKKGLEKAGLKAVSELLNKKIESTVIKKIHAFAGKSLTKKLAVSLGARGATMAVLIADDATFIGVLDDVVALGMGIWMASDIIEIFQLGRKALKIKGVMEKRSSLPIADIEPATEIDKKAIEAVLEVKGKKLESMSGEEIMDMIKSISDIRVKITRSGVSGYEEYRFVKGEVWSTKIMSEEGEMLELTDEELNKQITLPPPKEFKTWKIDYNAPMEKLLKNYRLALFYTKSECGFTKMDFEIKDDKTITIKRLDSGEEVNITRSGNTWQIENYKTGLSLFQAASLANLLGHTKNVIKKEKHKGGSSRPFEFDGVHIDFDREWNPVDLRILSGDKEKHLTAFYEKIGLKREDIIDILNNWYQTEYHYVSAA